MAEAVAHQHEIHAEWGGVVPALAKEAHMRAIDGLVETVLRESGTPHGSPSGSSSPQSPLLRTAGLQAQDLAGVAVTVGPGLGLCLRVGVNKARKLSYEGQVPIIPVHHMEAHALVARVGAEASPGLPRTGRVLVGPPIPLPCSEPTAGPGDGRSVPVPLPAGLGRP